MINSLDTKGRVIFVQPTIFRNKIADIYMIWMAIPADYIDQSENDRWSVFHNEIFNMFKSNFFGTRAIEIAICMGN